MRPERTLTADQLDDVPDPRTLAVAIRLVEEILDATEWRRTWIGRRPLLGVDRERQLVLALPVHDLGRGGTPLPSPLLTWPIDGLPTTEAEAADAVRRTLTEWWDHELRHVVRGPSGFAFDPHGDGDALPGADRRFHVDGR